ncbi:MAG: cytochrome c biogenesis protein CcsA [Clostridia bacterium]|nr:cytochrome c biogenesis protein CcsA [Clostridia bacterium]
MGIELQLKLYWAGVGIYTLAIIAYVTALIFDKPNLPAKASWLVAGGFIFHSAALLGRWIEAGRAPYWGFYEVAPASAWSLALVFLLVQWWWPRIKILGIIVMPIVLLTIGVGILSSKELAEIPRTFYTFWLGVHVIFAKLTFGGLLICAALGVFYLVKEKQERPNKVLDSLPSLETMDYLGYRFGAFGFIMMSIMIASGAVWAYKAWGRYWNWDPIETWSVISWLISGLYLHMRVTMGWKGRRGAWLAIFTLVAMIFAYYGVPLFFESIHEHL